MRRCQDERVAIRTHVLAVSMPGLRAVRWSTDQLYAGMKETYAIAVVEAGRSSYWSGGKVWSSGPGSLQIQQPGDVHRDVSRDGPSTCQIVTFPVHVVESVTGKVRVHPQLAADDARGAAFQRLHEAIDAGVKPGDIAPQVGLYDQSQLNRHFRRIVGTTPGQYARSV
jgi:AraC-like DNA-binding protein